MDLESLMSVDALLDNENFSKQDSVRARTMGELRRVPWVLGVPVAL